MTGWTPPHHRTIPQAPERPGSAWPPRTSPGRRGSWRRPPRCSAGDGSAFADLAERAAARFRAEYVTPSGRLAFPSQTAYALALELDLLTPEQRANAGRLLAQQVAADGYHIATGFLGTPFVTDALTNAGELATAYELLLQRENPSWLYPVTMGATTIWERWDSMLPDGTINPGDMTSFNHYAFGAVADWLHRTVGGLAPAAPGYRKTADRAAARTGDQLGVNVARDTLRYSGSGLDPGWNRVRAGHLGAAEHHRGGFAAGRQRDVRGRVRPALVRSHHPRAATGREAQAVLDATGMTGATIMTTKYDDLLARLDLAGEGATADRRLLLLLHRGRRRSALPRWRCRTGRPA